MTTHALDIFVIFPTLWPTLSNLVLLFDDDYENFNSPILLAGHKCLACYKPCTFSSLLQSCDDLSLAE